MKPGYAKCPHCYMAKALFSQRRCFFCEDTGEVPEFLAAAYALEKADNCYGLDGQSARELKSVLLDQPIRYILWLDDVRNPGKDRDHDIPRDALVIWANCVELAKFHVQRYGLPDHMYLDHDLGENSTVMEFLRWLHLSNFTPTFEYTVISMNPEGAKAIVAFIESWKRVYAEE